MSGQQITNPKQALRFMLAGKATVTVKSLASGDHLTFSVRRPKKQFGNITHFVSVRTGNDYARLGMIREERDFQTMNKADLPPADKRFTAFRWLFNNLANGIEPTKCEIWHEGTCGRCARPLTDPTSISIGLGPECRSKVGL